MKHYQAWCFDLDGTVYRGETAIPEAVRLIGQLRDSGSRIFFITNNSALTPQMQAEKLMRMGIRAAPEEIMTSSIATAGYLAGQYGRMDVTMIGEEGLREALEEAGHRIVTEGGEAVVVGIDRQISYDKLAAACLAVSAGAPFIATNGDLAFPDERGLVPGNGAFAGLIGSVTGVQPVVIGKPESHMIAEIARKQGLRKDGMILVGDNYETDIKAGLRFGIDTLHVDTGVTRKEALAGHSEQPTYSLRSLSEWEI
ncbi:TIGR01457 family HAD-type hydrolase [Edaphobacillus lindanitolerans]|uniref:4-nitrophenyl phosphatase n=1 Tax=Edaphobacillus lindanitolerans TaxID=550447 RepID=A0A1U7PQ78_9BACI|nr:TIGR01457 family HAD-type hydrolase [Edaphobacillus lindanitolerans]SIT91925.1 4-nitrophenyl phosphatase [Edaphobacillus lindanitolerans]